MFGCSSSESSDSFFSLITRCYSSSYSCKSFGSFFYFSNCWGLRALFEPDFKKVVALSTLSQLGIIVITLSIGFGKLAFIHLLTHAVFKALLFICRGKVIHSVGDYQDARKIGGEIFNLPITRAIIVLSRYALCGVPFLSGIIRFTNQNVSLIRDEED
ncbi:NADH-ubiquinone oxidoreductase chain 5 [Armadillidium vulgare]|nr:NADH-ubiquinone oxidoreductase chain 5 [Armadillidium vulgare]